MASKSVNKVILLGHLGKDAETKFTPSGVSPHHVYPGDQPPLEGPAVRRVEGRNRLAQFVMWRTENVANYLLKGKQIYVEGRLETRSYDDKEGQKKYTTEVVCEAQNLILLGGGGGRGDAPPEGGGDYDRPVSMPRSAQRPQASSTAPPNEDFNQGITDDDVPF